MWPNPVSLGRLQGAKKVCTLRIRIRSSHTGQKPHRRIVTSQGSLIVDLPQRVDVAVVGCCGKQQYLAGFTTNAQQATCKQSWQGHSKSCHSDRPVWDDVQLRHRCARLVHVTSHALREIFCSSRQLGSGANFLPRKDDENSIGFEHVQPFSSVTRHLFA